MTRPLIRLPSFGLVTLLMMGASTSVAQQLRVNGHGPSMHIGSSNDNAWTFGGGGEVMWHEGHWRYGALAGAYHNSVWSLTTYVGVAGSYHVTDWLGVGLGLSAATGYDEEVCYEMDNGSKSCYRLEWAKPVTVLPLPFVSIGRNVEVRIGGSTTLDAALMHFMVSVPIRAPW